MRIHNKFRYNLGIYHAIKQKKKKSYKIHNLGNNNFTISFDDNIICA